MKNKVLINRNSRKELANSIKNFIRTSTNIKTPEQKPTTTPEQKPTTTPEQKANIFNSKLNNIDVSIIIPLFKSFKVIKNQIENWPFYNDNLNKEIIYVDDKCPNESYKEVESSWENKNFPINLSAKIIKNDINLGYPKACNIGFKEAKGKYLIFLNADCVVFDDWISPMIKLLKDEKIGIVGNLQFKNNKIESEGSEWNWETKSFLHIGKSVYNGNLIKEQIELTKAEKNVKERDMVTGCCFAIRSNLFYDLNGFDENYKIGYWEDADLCMKVKEMGYKIMYNPNSKIHHEVSHSKSCSHIYKNHNRVFFQKRWIETGRIDNLIKNKRENAPDGNIKNNVNGKVVGCVIVCNEEEFLEASVNSVSPLVDEWVFVIGGNEYAYESKMCDKFGYPIDKTLEITKKLVKKYGGTIIEPPNRPWKDKVEMRNQYAKRLNENDWMFMLDGDEVYKTNQLWRITELMKSYECLILKFWTFWNKINVIGTGYWDSFPQERIVKWKNGYCYSDKNHLHVNNGNGSLVKSVVNTYKGDEKLFYHYSWIRPLEKIIQKRNYYKIQANKSKDDYIEQIFLKWRQNPNVSYTHPFGKGGWEIFKGIHPKQIQELINQGKLDF